MSKGFKPFAKDFGENVRKVRKQEGISQEELANKAEVERSYMGGIERGEKNPTLKKLYQISKALRVSIKKLFD